MKTFYHPDQTLHHPRTYFSRGQMRQPQEVPQRTEALLAAVKSLGFGVETPADAGGEPIARVHGLDYLRFLQDAHAEWMALGEDWGEEVVSNIFVREPNALRGVLAKAARYLADGSAPIGPGTFRAAYASAQCAVAGADALADGTLEAYALCRPPGHHARRDAAGGFCYLNNAAIAAERLRSRYKRVAILDTDMHHGQGIQEIFYDRRDVFYISIHGDPTNFYPVTAGYEDERGAGEGEGYNLNLPMPHGSPESVFFDRLAQAVRALEFFQPDALVLSLGFDIFERDPQAKVAVSENGFQRLGEAIGTLQLPTLIVQEGGYYIDGLKALSERFFTGFMSRRS
ncbi:histone deacetylase family protein [Mycoplana dimorpha]|uniref:Acetoin utilization deacetylase AcuC-like enzyme n=1 Tax=Mycoplana dimorpha TaxID=28320 RepID=A0A2T5BF00_MYCDI|nr:histone deacetylase family protein [Mycoplana dimorpha]PTM97528.1 acetoin utilization deacetylase AcuC-like enzyme [Mycoplana dimorpha]